jgi:hypothetical protein
MEHGNTKQIIQGEKISKPVLETTLTQCQKKFEFQHLLDSFKNVWM